MRYCTAALFIAASFAVSGCSLRSGQNDNLSQLDFDVQHAPKALMDPDIERQSTALHSFLVGQLAYDEQDFDTALENFQLASELSTVSSPGIHARLAELYVKQTKLDKALSEARKALESDPDNSSFLQLYAGILEALDREAEAAPVYKRLIEQDPDKVEPQLLYSNLLIRQNKLDDAINQMKKFERRFPNDSANQYHLGRAYELQESYSQAERYYRKAYKSHGMDSRIASDLIRVLLRQQKIDEVRQTAEVMLEKDPDDNLARKILSELAIGEGRFEEAIGHLRSLEETEADADDARYKIALIQIERQNYQEAEQQLLLVLAEDAQNFEARYYLASIYAGKGRRQDAVEQLFLIPEESEIFSKARTFAGFLLRQVGDYDRAETAVKSALQVDPNDKKTLSYLILILRDSKKFREAKDVIEDALKTDPENDRLLFNYAVVLHDLGKEEEALLKMQDVVKLNPQHADALNFVAYSLTEEGGDLVKAERLIKQALKLRPNDGYFLDTLGWIYFKRKSYKDAVEYLARAVSLTGDDVVILEHYADALYASDEIVNSFDIYKRAYAFGKESEDELGIPAAVERIFEKLKKIVKSHPQYNLHLPNQ